MLQREEQRGSPNGELASFSGNGNRERVDRAGERFRPQPSMEALLSRVKTADGIFAVDSVQRIVHWGASAEEILGIPAEEALGRSCYEVVGGVDGRNARFCRKNCPIMASARRGRPTRDYDILVHRPDGNPRWINMSILVSPSERGNGRAPVVVHVFRDVTDRRHAERAAYEAINALRSVLDKAGEEGRKETASPPPPPPALTRRELEVLRLLADGLSTQAIGETLHISPVTARNHVTNALAKLGAKSRLQAVVYASQRQII